MKQFYVDMVQYFLRTANKLQLTDFQTRVGHATIFLVFAHIYPVQPAGVQIRSWRGIREHPREYMVCY